MSAAALRERRPKGVTASLELCDALVFETLDDHGRHCTVAIEGQGVWEVDLTESLQRQRTDVGVACAIPSAAQIGKEHSHDAVS